MSPIAINLAAQKPIIPDAAELHQFVKVEFHRFKVLGTFTLNLRHFNILVGPNNDGKSKVLAAFRIFATALRKANARCPEVVRGTLGDTFGYAIDLTATVRMFQKR